MITQKIYNSETIINQFENKLNNEYSDLENEKCNNQKGS